MNGILGAWDLLANVNQAIYTNNYSGVNVVVVNLCNKSQEEVTVRIAVSSSLTAPSDAEWIVYNAPVGPRSAYERTSILVSPGKHVVVRASSNSVNAVCFGVTNAATAPGTNTRNLGSAPTWVTGATLPTVYAGDYTTSLQLSATDAEGEAITYSLSSGSLQGMTLSSTGLLSGTPSVTGYVSGVADSTTPVTINATDTRGNVTPRVFSITRRWRDGSSSGQAAVSAAAIKAMTGTTTNGLYHIQPVGAPTAQQVFCIMDNSIGDGGGWMAAFNLLSTTNSGVPGGAADWYNSDFWDTQENTFNTTSTLTSNFKNYVYGYAPARKVGFLLHNISNTSFRGYGFYDLLTGVAGNTLFQLCGGGNTNVSNVNIDNRIASGARTEGSGVAASGCVRNTLRPQTEYGDLFIDQQNAWAPLVFRQRDAWESTGGYLYNAARIATRLGDGNMSYGHTFAGIGGTHENSGWKGDFALAPVSPYCDNPQSYGDRTTGVNMTQYDGWSYPYSTTCTTNTNGQLNVGYGVFVK